MKSLIIKANNTHTHKKNPKKLVWFWKPLEIDLGCWKPSTLHTFVETQNWKLTITHKGKKSKKKKLVIGNRQSHIREKNQKTKNWLLEIDNHT